MRDFYPAQMAWRRHLEDLWRKVSIRNGFEEVDGPIFETLDLYKHKSGEGIVSELFSFSDRGDRELAIRAEFTPTLARMAAERANSMARPIKWFAIPNLCRAERPQRGRLREHWQWNVDILGLDSLLAEVEVIATAVDALQSLGLNPTQIRVKISHRTLVGKILTQLGVVQERLAAAFELLDRRDRTSAEAFTQQAAALGMDGTNLDRLNQVIRAHVPADGPWELVRAGFCLPEQDLEELQTLHEGLRQFGVSAWCEYDLSIVRGLAYYTGTVFEIHEATGAERAIAGGGRYDNLIEAFGGPAMSAAGFGMGDVVLGLVLEDKGLIPKELAPPTDIFVAAATEAGRAQLHGLVMRLRRAGLHTRFSYRDGGGLAKQLKEADQCGARWVVILDNNFARGLVTVKNMVSGQQQDVKVAELDQVLRME